MNKHIQQPSDGRFRFRLFTMAGAMVLSLLVIFGVMTMAQRALAESADSYCSQYTTNGKLNACKSGIRGEDCSDYAITYDQATADICSQAARAKASGQVTDLPTFKPKDDGGLSTDEEAYRNAILSACSPYQSDSSAALWCLYGGLGQNGTEGKPKSTQDCLKKPELQGSSTNQGACVTGSTAGQSYLAAKNGTPGGGTDNNIGTEPGTAPGAGGGDFSLQDTLDQTKDLSQYIDLLHAFGPDAKTDTNKVADNSYGSYINGAGKQQDLRVWPCLRPTEGGCPAILYLNGGGWHANDGTSFCLATGSPQKNCTPGKDGGPDGGVGDQGPPVGGGALARGYALIEITYRLGSSGVYYMFEDVMRGIQHVRNNAKMYGIDANKTVIWGDSAGGSLSIRAGSSGKSGVRVMVGWSAPTNGYTGLFKSYKTLLIGMDHSTCIPTDLAGAANFTSLLTGGGGDVAEYGQGLASNDFTSLENLFSGKGGGAGALSLVTEVLTAGQYAAQTSQNIESISQQLKDDPLSMSGGLINLSTQKLIECIDNFNALSPALFASPDSPPGFLAGFDIDDLIDPQQAYDMRDKLQGMGIKAEALIIPGDPNQPAVALGATNNHMGYDPRFVCPTINFIDEVIQPDKPRPNCATGAPTG